MTLTKHAIATAPSGQEYGTGRVFQYRVHGLPLNEEALIANFGSCNHDSWKTLQVKYGVHGDWQGHYASADEALAAIARR